VKFKQNRRKALDYNDGLYVKFAIDVNNCKQTHLVIAAC